eukprot:GHVQ01034595.1.p1 GENE.GHVQ01034595.1~~GHVQ01034595.1.p1  ORF type:complete len:209 (+),score=34.39 GHVQ01034595.1:647-1273(+)
MRLIGLFVGRCDGTDVSPPVVFLSSAFDLHKFSFFEKKVVKEACVFLARTAVPRVTFNKREVITHEESLAFVYRWTDGMFVCAIAEHDYPQRIGFDVIHKIRRCFIDTVSHSVWISADEGSSNSTFRHRLTDLLTQYQNPATFDKVVQAQQRTETVQEQMQHNITALLHTGENIETLVAKSNDLSESSKVLFKSSRKLKKRYACCKTQ